MKPESLDFWFGLWDKIVPKPEEWWYGSMIFIPVWKSEKTGTYFQGQATQEQITDLELISETVAFCPLENYDDNGSIISEGGTSLTSDGSVNPHITQI